MSPLPLLIARELNDPYHQQNIQALNTFFTTNTPLLDFKFFELSFTTNSSHFLLPHRLGYAPKDIVQLSIKGTGSVVFNYAIFDKNNVDMTISGTSTTDPLIIRFLVGTYTVNPVASGG